MMTICGDKAEVRNESEYCARAVHTSREVFGRPCVAGEEVSYTEARL
jgi:hypothetical protein